MTPLSEILEKAKELKKNVKYREVIDLTPDSLLNTYKSADLYAEKAEAYLELRETNSFFDVVNKGLALDANHARSFCLIGHAYLKLKQYDKAIEANTKAMEIDPDSAVPYNGLGNVYCSIDQNDKAIEFYGKAIEIDPTYASPYNGLGNVYKEQNQFGKAVEYYEKAIDIYPTYAFAYDGLGSVYCQLALYDKATENYNKSISINPNSSAPYDGLGLVAYWLDQYNEAIQHYSRAISIDQNDDSAYYNRALAYSEAKEYEKALEDYTKYVELTKAKPDYYTSVAQSKILELEKLIGSPDFNTISLLVNDIKKLLLFKDETVTHYTSLTVVKMLIISDSSFRLSEGAYLNDTSEGRELFNFLSFHTNTKVNNDTIAEPFAKKPFIGSFVAENKHDDLTLWRMYGKENKEEAKGCAITLNKEMFLNNLKEKLAPGKEITATSKDNEEFNFYRVAYRKHDEKEMFILPGAEKDEDELNNYMRQLARFIKNFNSKDETSEVDKQNVLELLNGIAYLFKSVEYQYEHELRLVVKGTGIDKNISTDQIPRVWIELVNINPILKKITLGPKVERADEWAAAFFYKLDKDGYNPEILISHLPFK
ncbi:tetratricopeptide repeat protein [Chitinophaga sp. SYP-B3965]|uniref:tetratricopeptide repeat protein n=1 Tax=Chitinophaga sp. SYP-B3965 TaxID=2663120 RepID=UPI001299D906|nr:tetratricopeptide repeat protein [Chitinophaga sp. SYP-B3965]MRG48442.1 tetratricopeptide repeat protein [Chitinophaga sp. SYP-B3965]